MASGQIAGQRTTGTYPIEVAPGARETVWGGPTGSGTLTSPDFANQPTLIEVDAPDTLYTRPNGLIRPGMYVWIPSQEVYLKVKSVKNGVNNQFYIEDPGTSGFVALTSDGFEIADWIGGEPYSSILIMNNDATDPVTVYRYDGQFFEIPAMMSWSQGGEGAALIEPLIIHNTTSTTIYITASK